MPARLAQPALFKSWPKLAADIAHTVRADDAIIDGEIFCLSCLRWWRTSRAVRRVLLLARKLLGTCERPAPTSAAAKDGAFPAFR